MKPMNRQKLIPLELLLAMTLGLVACQDENVNAVSAAAPSETVASKPTPAMRDVDSASTGKPSAPISMTYEVLGNPVVGSPVSINVAISTTGGQGPVDVRYSISDRSSLDFQQGQVESLQVRDARTQGRQQLAVIPRREGRLYVNVSAEIQTADGSMIKSMAIPIQVGSAPNKPKINGELVEGPDGETVISMPAKEN
jgi:hypothetical protein